MKTRMPKISTDYALMNNYFSGSPIKDESVAVNISSGKYQYKNYSNGDILRDLGLTTENETDIQKTIRYLDVALENFDKERTVICE